MTAYKKIFCLVLFLIISFILILPPFKLANATSLRTDSFYIKCHPKEKFFKEDKFCLNNDCSLFLDSVKFATGYGLLVNLPHSSRRAFSDEIGLYTFSVTEFYFTKPKDYTLDDLINVFDNVCKESLASVSTLLKSEIDSWLADKIGGLVIEPYTQSKIEKLTAENKEETWKLTFKEFKQVDGWIFIKERLRSSAKVSAEKPSEVQYSLGVLFIILLISLLIFLKKKN